MSKISEIQTATDRATGRRNVCADCNENLEPTYHVCLTLAGARWYNGPYCLHQAHMVKHAALQFVEVTDAEVLP